MWIRLSSPTVVLGLAIAFGLLLASCGDPQSGSLSTEDAGVGATGALDSALENANDANDQNPNTLQTGSLSPSALSRATRGLTGLGAPTGGLPGINQATGSGGPLTVSWTGTYPCSAGGTVAVQGQASATWDWNNGAGTDLAYWHESVTLSGMTLTLSDCSEDAYTMNGTAVYTATNSYAFDQTADQSSLYTFGFDIDEAASADLVATYEPTGRDYDLTIAWTLAGTLGGDVDVISGDSEVTAVNVNATYDINDISCTGTWTDPSAGWNVSCHQGP